MHPIAIACGNTFVLKPSERGLGVSNLVASPYADAALPDSVFIVVHGDKVAVDTVLEHRERLYGRDLRPVLVVFSSLTWTRRSM